MGVRGGLPLMLLFILVLTAAFRSIGKALQNDENRSPGRDFLIWTVGVALFGQVVNFWSITLFDQSVSFFYLVLAMIGAAFVRNSARAPSNVYQPVRAPRVMAAAPLPTGGPSPALTRDAAIPGGRWRRKPATSESVGRWRTTRGIHS
jgi:hypothetical protein